MKNIYFLCGLPRCGNTLLASILNQNSNISVTANSITADILYNLEQLKETKNFKNFPNHKSLDNLIKQSLQIYYKNHKSNHIIDRSPWGTPKNIELIEKYITTNSKFIILERPLIEILGSFSKIKNWNKNNIDDICHYEITKGITASYCYSLYNILQTNNNYIRINYNDLIANPKNYIDCIYKFLNIPKHNHRYVDLKQLNINNIQYDDTVLETVHHYVKEEKIEKNNYDINQYLTKSVIDKYKNISVEKLGKLIFNNERI